MKEKIIDFFSWSCLFLTVLSLSIALTINSYFLYAFDIHWLAITKETGLSFHVLMKNYFHLMTFLNVPFVNTLSFSHFTMSSSGFSHFQEVKRLFLFDYVLFLVTVYPSYSFFKKKSTQVPFTTKKKIKKMMLFPFFLLFGMSLGFDRFFVFFHRVLFRNTDWLFDPVTDSIILALPETFFLHCFLLAFFWFELLLFLMTHFISNRSSINV